MRLKYLSLISSLWFAACGSAPQPGGDLLSELRQKNHHLTGQAVSPTQAAQMHGQPSTQTTPNQKTKEPTRFDEIKIITPSMLEQSYPSSRYLTGVGYTEDLDLNQAIQNAKEQVAASISSEIESTTTVTISAGRETTGGRTRSGSRSRQEMKSVQRVKFAHAELIQVDRKQTGCTDKRCVAVAYIERQVLARKALSEFTPLVQRYQRLTQECQRLGLQGDVLSFAERFAATESVYIKLNKIGPGLEVILGSNAFKDWQKVKSQRDQLLGVRDDLIARSPLIIDSSAIKHSELGTLIAEQHRQDLLALGAKTRAFFGGSSACEGQSTGALHLAFSGNVEKRSLQGIKIYELKYPVVMTQCKGQRIVAKFTLNLKFSIPDNSTLAKSAENKLNKLSLNNRQAFYEALHLTLPLNNPK